MCDSLPVYTAEAYMELKGNRLNSSSVVILTDIGEQLSGTQEPDTVRGDALVCVTNYTDCCRGADGSPGGVGRWFFPDDVEVPGIGGEVQHNGIYRNRGTGLVRLNRQANSPLEVDGQYCCEIPVSPTNMERLCVTIGELSPSVRKSLQLEQYIHLFVHIHVYFIKYHVLI